MPQFASLGHVALRVKNIDASLDFYTNRLKLKEMLRLLYDDGSLFLVYVRITDRQYLELFPYGIGDRMKERAWHRWPFTRYPSLLPRGEAFFHKWGWMSVVLCRFFSPARATVPLLCGIFEMPPIQFQLANWGSAFLWGAVVMAIGKVVERVFG